MCNVCMYTECLNLTFTSTYFKKYKKNVFYESAIVSRETYCNHLIFFKIEMRDAMKK